MHRVQWVRFFFFTVTYIHTTLLKRISEFFPCEELHLYFFQLSVKFDFCMTKEEVKNVVANLKDGNMLTPTQWPVWKPIWQKENKAIRRARPRRSS